MRPIFVTRVMTDIFNRKGADDAFASRPGADIELSDGCEDAPRPAGADDAPGPGRGRGYVLDAEAGLDWLFGGSIESSLDIAHLVPLRTDPDSGKQDEGGDPILIRSRRSRRRRAPGLIIGP